MAGMAAGQLGKRKCRQCLVLRQWLLQPLGLRRQQILAQGVTAQAKARLGLAALGALVFASLDITEDSHGKKSICQHVPKRNPKLQRSFCARKSCASEDKRLRDLFLNRAVRNAD